MSLIWNDINNGESALSVRDKLNTFNNSVVTETASISNATNTNTADIAAIESGYVQKTGDTIDDVQFSGGSGTAGTVSWNNTDKTLDVIVGEATLQVGQELYIQVINNSGSTISNGSVVGFAGVSGNNLQITPYTADNTESFLGVLTQTLANGAEGKVTVLGKVRNFNTTGSPVGETWAVGDAIYASATTPGALTKVRPTAPNNIITVGIVVTASTTGDILVAPVLDESPAYIQLDSLGDNTVAAANTAYELDAYAAPTVYNKISIVDTTKITVADAGLYKVSATLQVVSSTAATNIMYFWLRKNGVDVPNSRIDHTLTDAAQTQAVTLAHTITLAANDYIQIMYAATDTVLKLDYNAATGFAPASPSASVNVTQIHR